MQRIACLLLAIAAVAYSQQSFTVYPLVNGVTYAGSLEIETSQAYGYDVDLFSFWVPENTSGVNVTVTNGNFEDCDSLYLYIRSTSGLPCSYSLYDNDEYLCGDADHFESYIDDVESDVLISGSDSGLYGFNVNSNWYFGVGRYSSSYYDQTCPYTLTVSINSSCPVGSLGVASDLYSSYASACTPAYHNVSTSDVTVITNNNGPLQAFKINIPNPSVGNVQFRLNSTVTSSYIYGRNYGAPSSSSSSYDCYTGSYQTVNNFYIYTLNCWVPRAGDFFFVLQDDNNAYNASVSISMVQCAPGFGGYNCTFPSIPYNASLVNGNVLISYPSGVNYLSYPFMYTYIDVVSPYVGPATFQLLASSTDDAYIYIRKDGFPEYNSYDGYYGRQSTPGSFSINQFDTAVAGRYYFALSCETTPGCNVTVASNSTGSTGPITTASSGVSTASSGVSTATSNTGTTTATTTATSSTAHPTSTATGVSTSQATTAEGSVSSPASVIVPSIVFVVAALSALLL